MGLRPLSRRLAVLSPASCIRLFRIVVSAGLELSRCHWARRVSPPPIRRRIPRAMSPALARSIRSRRGRAMAGSVASHDWDNDVRGSVVGLDRHFAAGASALRNALAWSSKRRTRRRCGGDGYPQPTNRDGQPRAAWRNCKTMEVPLIMGLPEELFRSGKSGCQLTLAGPLRTAVPTRRGSHRPNFKYFAPYQAAMDHLKPLLNDAVLQQSPGRSIIAS